MINVLLPSMGKSTFFKDAYFPKPLTEICGKTMLEFVVNDYNSLEDKSFIFVFSDQDCKKFHIDASVGMLTKSSKVIKLQKQTAGALCTCLMAIDYIDNDIPLIIANSDQIINYPYSEIIERFNNEDADAGVITFPNVHPRWSYALIEDERVVEVAEKRPLSKHAIAGFYYFKKGSDFIDSAKQVLLKQNNLDGIYYISSSLNELILNGKKVSYHEIEKSKYNSFYSPAKIREYEESIK